MEPAITIGLLWLSFGLTHIGLATTTIRGRLVRRLGERRFVFLFSGVAAVAFTALVMSYSALRLDGAAGPALGRIAALRPILISFIVLGVVLMAGTFATYDRSPYAAIGRSFPGPRGLERITRHPFFAGLTIFSLAHALLATRLVGCVFLVGYAVVSVLGAWHQDRKLAARLGAPFVEYLSSTSAVPFAAILAGRQRLVWSELPVSVITAGLAIALALRAIHGSLFAYGGIGFVGVVLASVVAILVATLRREASLRAMPSVRTAAS
jgi:uncharacterized membrane protein